MKGVTCKALGTLWAVAALMLLGQQIPAAAPTQCFSLRQWDGRWKAGPANRSIIIRLQSGRVYQLVLSAPQPLLKDPFAYLTDRQMDSTICGPLDFQLTLSNRAGLSEALAVTKMKALTPSDVDKLPKDERP